MGPGRPLKREPERRGTESLLGIGWAQLVKAEFSRVAGHLDDVMGRANVDGSFKKW